MIMKIGNNYIERDYTKTRINVIRSNFVRNFWPVNFSFESRCLPDCDQNQFVFRLGRMNGRKLPKARHGCRCFYWRSIDKHLHLTSHFRNLRTPRNAPRPTRQLSRNDKTTPRPLFYDFKIRESGSSFLKKEKKKLKILLRLTFLSFIFRKR